MSGVIILANEKIKACYIEIAKHVLDVTLIALDMRDLNVVSVGF